MSAGSPASVPARDCFHCSLPIPPGIALQVDVHGAPQPVCCHGCLAVAELILGQGLDAYYERREVPGDRQDETGADAAREYEVYDDPEVQRDFARDHDGAREASLVIEGMHCAACAWLIERHLSGQPGVGEIRVSLANHRARVEWDADRTALSAIFGAIRALGYRAHPYLPDREEERGRAEQRRALRRLGVAGLGTMQVMMFAVGLYAAGFSEGGIEPVYRDFLRWVSLLVATGVVVYSARPFFAGALRDLRMRAPGMDVPVALAIGFAYLASLWATATGSGEVYFDAVCMFTFFLGLGRFLEMRIRHASEARVRALLHRLPETARRLVGDAEELVPARALRPGDEVIVRPGGMIPADGAILEGESAADESLLTGEADARPKQPGDRVIGGSRNLASPLRVRVEAVGPESTLALIGALLDRALLERPPAVRAADRWARWFVAAVIGIAAGVGLAWWWVSPEDAFWIVLSVLVATCPCALSLATPAALAAATHALVEDGFLVARGHVLETLARATHVVFDKTGTLTESGTSLVHVVPTAGHSEEAVLEIARGLERRSEHPIAQAFAQGPGGVVLSDLRAEPNRGVAGTRDGRELRLGRPEWVAELFVDAQGPGERPASDALEEKAEGPASWILLGAASGPLAWFGLATRTRDDAAEAVRWLAQEGIEVSLLSGDPSSPAVSVLAEQLGIDEYASGATPSEKLEIVEQMQHEGAVVAGVGDGINDAPLLGRADVSIAMGGGTDLARMSADAVLLGDRLSALPRAFALARRTRAVIRQNLAWAVLYNLAVLPLAALGYVQPWMAAIGMSASSLLVVANALRLHRSPARP